MVRFGFDEEVKAAGNSAIKKEDVTDVTSAASVALQPESESAIQVLIVPTTEYCFAKDTSLSELGDLHELDTSSALHQDVNLMLADSLYSTRTG